MLYWNVVGKLLDVSMLTLLGVCVWKALPTCRRIGQRRLNLRFANILPRSHFYVHEPI